MISRDLSLFFFLLMSFLFCMLVGLIYLSQLFIPSMQKVVLDAMLPFIDSAKKYKSVIVKNLESHAPRNSKAGLMLTTAIAFLIFCTSAFSQIEYLSLSITAAVVNADASLFIANEISGTSPISLNEQALSKLLDEEMSREDSIVKGYNYLGWTANEILSGSGNRYSELGIRFGLKNLRMYGVNVHALPKDHLENSMSEYLYPDEILNEEPYYGNSMKVLEHLDYLSTRSSFNYTHD